MSNPNRPEYSANNDRHYGEGGSRDPLKSLVLVLIALLVVVSVVVAFIWWNQNHHSEQPGEVTTTTTTATTTSVIEESPRTEDSQPSVDESEIKGEIQKEIDERGGKIKDDVKKQLNDLVNNNDAENSAGNGGDGADAPAAQ